MREINDFIKSVKEADCRTAIIAVLSQTITAISVDNKKEIKELIPKLIMDLSIYEQILNKDSVDMECETDSGQEISGTINGVNSGADDKKEKDDSWINEVVAIVKEEQNKEETNIISISEVPSYTIKVYDGKNYAIDEKEYDRFGRIMIPSTDKYDYWLKVYIADEEHILYAEKKDFEKEFPYIKAAYIREYSEEGIADEKMRINDMFDSLLDLSLLCSDTKEAIYINNHIEIHSKPKSETQLRLEGRRQSYIDNYNIRFIYEENSGVYHDKSCKDVKLIDLEHLMGSENPPEGYKPCKTCQMEMLIRKGCKDDFKNVSLYKYFFTRGNVSENTLAEFLSYKNASFRIESVGKLKVVCKDDSWKIETDGRGTFVNLYHNNYTVDKKGIRHFDGGYHIQQTDMVMDVKMAFEYIMDYNFKKNHK